MENEGIKGMKQMTPNGVDNLESTMEEAKERLVSSEEMDMHISIILEKIDRFTQQVSETLESGKAMFQDLSLKFEERLIEIHTEQIQKWQEQIKMLRLYDASNEEVYTLLQKTRSHLLQNCDIDS